MSGFKYSDEQRALMDKALSKGLPELRLDDRTKEKEIGAGIEDPKPEPRIDSYIEQIENAAGVYLSLVQNLPSATETKSRLNTLIKAIGDVREGMKQATSVLAVGAADLHKEVDVFYFFSGIDRDLNKLSSIASKAVAKLPTKPGRPRKPIISSPGDSPGVPPSTGSPMDWFVSELAHIWKTEQGEWPKRDGRRLIPYPEGWEDLTEECLAPLQRPPSKDISGLGATMKRISERG